MLDHIPVEPFHPGEYISDELEARGWTQEDLAEITGISRRQIINLISGKSGVTAETAHALAQAFEQEAKSWMELQIVYELAVASKQSRDTAKRAKIYNKLPIRDVKRRGWLRECADTKALETEVCRFLGITELDERPHFLVAAKMTVGAASYTPAQIAWFARARHLAHAAPAAKYCESNLEAGIQDLKKLTGHVADVRRVPRQLADMGIRFVVIETLPKAKVDGVAFWLNDNESPAVALSTRFDRIDNFWFTLMHELVHIKYRDESPLDVDLLETVADDNIPDIERVANQEAADYLIPKEKMDSFISRNKPSFYKDEIVRFANVREVHPALVVGQLRYRKQTDWKFHSKLMDKFRSELVGNALMDGWDCTPQAVNDGDANDNQD